MAKGSDKMKAGKKLLAEKQDKRKSQDTDIKQPFKKQKMENGKPKFQKKSK